MTTLSANTLNEAFSSVRLKNQDIEGSVSVGDLVYFSASAQQWGVSESATPTGLYIGSDTIVLKGYAGGLTSLTAGEFYYMNSSGKLTSNSGDAFNNVKVGFSISTTELLVDIDVFGTNSPLERGFGDVVFSTDVGERDFGLMTEGVDYSVSGNTLRLNLNQRYLFRSFELKSGTVLSCSANVSGAVMHIECTEDCIIDGTVTLNNRANFGNHPTEWDYNIDGVVYSSPGVAPGGRNTRAYSVSSQYVPTSGYGIGGAGWGTSTFNPGGSVSGGKGGSDGSDMQSSNTPWVRTDTSYGATGTWTLDGNDGNTNSSAGGSGYVWLWITDNINRKIRVRSGGGAATYGSNGFDAGISSLGSGTVTMAYIGHGGGGAGGRASRAGVHFYVKADTINFTGTINTSGTDGQRGGQGGRTGVNSSTDSLVMVYSSGFVRGYPGSSGGGGNAGNVYFFYTTSIVNSGVVTSEGGVGGEKNDALYNNNTVFSENTGQKGEDGTDGSLFVTQLT